MTAQGATEAEVPIAATRSTALGKYELFARIGRGGMADVFLALARGPMGFNKLAVVKRLRDTISDQPTMIDMFLDEARLAARLQHPNVVHTYDVGAQDDAYFIAMEYLEGQPLHRISRAPVAREQITTAGWCHLIAEALAGLHHAHDLCDYDGQPLNIVHRDVSPHNIFVTYAGDVKVVDFGIAKTALNTTETATGILKGKVNYMAPEQVVGEVDRRADLYSMGLTLWEVLAGKGAYRGDAVQVLNRVLNEPVPSLTDVLPNLDPRLEAIVKKATERDRELRYQTADEFREALLGFVRDSGEVIRKGTIGKTLSTVFSEIREKLAAQVKLHMGNLVAVPPPSGDALISLTGTGTLPSLAEFATSSSTGTPPSIVQKASSGATGSGTAVIALAPPTHHAQPSTPRASEPTPSAAPPPPRGRGRAMVFVGLGLLAVALSVVAWKVMGSGDPAGAIVPVPVAFSLTIESLPPDATVDLDGRVVGRTPVTLTLGAGPRTLSVTKEGYGVETLAVELTPREPVATRVVTLRPSAPAKDPVAVVLPTATVATPATTVATNARPVRTPVSTWHPPTPAPAAPPHPHTPATAAPTPAAPSATAIPEKGSGFLSLTTFPWSRVSEGGRPLGTTPLYRVPLSTGTHVLVLENPDDGIRTTYSVTIKAGEATSRSVEIK